MRNRSRRADAALLIAGLLLAPAIPRPASPSRDCTDPHDEPHRAEGLPAVRCAGGPAAHPLRGAARLLFRLPLDLNRADARDLEALPGIGPVRARAIAQERARSPFCVLADLARVPGVGPRTLERLDGLAAAGSPAGCRVSRGSLYTASENP